MRSTCVAGARAPVAVGGLGAVGLGALPAGRRVGVGEGAAALRADIVEARRAVGVAAIAAPARGERPAAIAVAVAAVGIARLGDLDMGFRQFVEEARRDGRLPQAVDAAVGDEPDVQVLLGARQADIGEAALFLEARAAALVERALVREQAFLPAGQEDGVELQPLGGMQRHDGDGVELGVLLGVHDQRDMLEEASAATRTPPSSGSVPSGFPAGPAPRPSGRSSTCRCSRSPRGSVSASSVCGVVSSAACQRAKLATTSRSAARGFGFSSSVSASSAAAASIGTPRRARACRGAGGWSLRRGRASAC